MKIASMLVVGLAVGLGATGCGKAKAGDPCSNPECLDSSTAFACDNGVYRSVPCRGPQGCSTASPGATIEVECDESLDVAGDNCAAEDVGSVQCENRPNAIQCAGGEVWTAVQCPNTCTPGPSGVGACT